ncbi:alpha/beta hydrolase [Nannocystaceae bacterium ST9]
MTIRLALAGLGLCGLACAAAGVGDEGVAGSESDSSESGASSASEAESESSATGSEGESGGSGSGSTASSDSESSDSESSGSDSGETGEPPIVEVTTLAYGADPAQQLDLYLPSPASADPLPVLVLAHGGLWQSGDRSALANLCTQVVLGSKGAQACASIDYRLSQELGGTCAGGGPDTYEGQLADFAAAFARLQVDADMYGLDPARMFVGGHSAGGHLAQVLNLRWSEFAAPCNGDCPPAIAAIGIEGIYDIPAWNAYDQSFWNGTFACATRKAFGDAPGSPQACVDADFGLPCWHAGSATHLADHADELGISPVGNALMIHSPGDDWVDIAEASTLAAALDSAFPGIIAIVAIDGTCAAGNHNGLLDEAALADCLIAFVDSDATAI